MKYFHTQHVKKDVYRNIRHAGMFRLFIDTTDTVSEDRQNPTAIRTGYTYIHCREDALLLCYLSAFSRGGRQCPFSFMKHFLSWNFCLSSYRLYTKFSGYLQGAHFYVKKIVMNSWTILLLNVFFFFFFFLYLDGLSSLISSHSELIISEIWLLYDSRQDPLDGGISPSQGRYLHRTTQTQKKRRHTSMPWVGFEPTIAVLLAGENISRLRPRGHCDCSLSMLIILYSVRIWTEFISIATSLFHASCTDCSIRADVKTVSLAVLRYTPWSPLEQCNVCSCYHAVSISRRMS
jgi:hypothetical protein